VFSGVLFPRTLGPFAPDTRPWGARALLRSRKGGALVASGGRLQSRSGGGRSSAASRSLPWCVALREKDWHEQKGSAMESSCFFAGSCPRAAVLKGRNAKVLPTSSSGIGLFGHWYGRHHSTGLCDHFHGLGACAVRPLRVPSQVRRVGYGIGWHGGGWGILRRLHLRGSRSAQRQWGIDRNRRGGCRYHPTDAATASVPTSSTSPRARSLSQAVAYPRGWDFSYRILVSQLIRARSVSWTVGN
jgi:hypothetical protein